MACKWIQLPGGGVAHINMGNRRPALCQTCRKKPHTKLCDFPAGDGKTCDKRLCDGCAVHVGPDADHCPDHTTEKPVEEIRRNLFPGLFDQAPEPPAEAATIGEAIEATKREIAAALAVPPTAIKTGSRGGGKTATMERVVAAAESAGGAHVIRARAIAATEVSRAYALAKSQPEPVIIPPGHCVACNHPKKAHCKGGVVHGRWRVPMGVEAPADTRFVCATTHCESPVCSCTHYAATDEDLLPGQRRYGTVWTVEDHLRWNPQLADAALRKLGESSR